MTAIDNGAGTATRSARDAIFVFALLLGTRVVLGIIGELARIYLLPLRSDPYAWDYPGPPWLAVWGQWDSRWYLDIAASGYSMEPSHDAASRALQANYAFFPLYPLAMRLLAPLFGGPFGAGLAISNAALFAACLILMKLVRLDSDEATARRAAKYLVLLPTAFMFSGVLTESLFVALAVACFHCVRTDRLAVAGACGFLAALTRSVGVLLIVPLALLLWQQRRVLPLWPRTAWLLLIPLGLVAFAAYDYSLTGDPFAFVHIQAVWNRQLRSPADVLVLGLASIADPDAAFSAWLTLAAILLLVLNASRLGAPYLVLSFLLIVAPLSSSIYSMPRLMLVVFPIPIALAQLARTTRIDRALTATLALVQGALMASWACGFKLVV